MRVVVEIEQGGDRRVHLQDYVPTATAVAAVWSAQRLEFFAVHRGATVATVAGSHGDGDSIHEVDCHGASSGVTLTNQGGSDALIRPALIDVQ
jgi:hypothetical protein